jgi:hypothetical protein
MSLTMSPIPYREQTFQTYSRLFFERTSLTYLLKGNSLITFFNNGATYDLFVLRILSVAN